MDLTPEEQFAAEEPEKMIPRMFAEGFEREEIIATLLQLSWPPEEATYLVDAYLAKREGRAMPPRLPVVTGKPPVALVILCAMGFAGIVVSLALASSPRVREISPKLAPYILIIGLIKALCYLGILRMRRVAVAVFFATFLADQISFPLTGNWSPLSCVFSLGVVFTGIAYWSKME